MLEKDINDLLNAKLHNESFFTETIDLGNYKIYPFYELSLISNSENMGHCSISPIAIIICMIINNQITDYYLHYFDESHNNETSTKDILNKFYNETEMEIK
ncbi:hypothetical protein KQY27_04420 [Methanobrevibacter sp. TMH8]|uniref:hypothetical protein n=1 Tax=Methanobrevibacter sp. TMH8 TaxID=2848611 RepID=UPI001CCAE658|nr:hypothetical protein [Methanobrevibacter sp. TMH8]MBZ9570791.1 hypothetical protein [Methanobrevibacter sp. TMH8]